MRGLPPFKMEVVAAVHNVILLLWSLGMFIFITLDIVNVYQVTRRERRAGGARGESAHPSGTASLCPALLPSGSAHSGLLPPWLCDCD